MGENTQGPRSAALPGTLQCLQELLGTWGKPGTGRSPASLYPPGLAQAALQEALSQLEQTETAQGLMSLLPGQV